MGIELINKVQVALRERSYEIRIGSGLLDSAGQWLNEWVAPSKSIVITDENVRTYASRVAASLQHARASAELLTVPPGENSKSIACAQQLWRQMLELGADRKSVVVAVGGGVVGDLAGFVAATYARGLPFVQAPTTLLAHVDSSVGGKVGINLPHAKNMVGAFWQPRGVLIDLDTLNTLPDREYRAGLAEVVKYGVIMDPAFFEFLESNVDSLNQRDSATLSRVIQRCCELKAEVVAEDEREETGRRAILNYGHTFCHAIEAVAGYGEYLHGEAVSIGMLCASRLAETLGRIPHEVTERQQRLLESLQLPTQCPDLDREALCDAMLRDKKVEHGRLRFILPNRLGHVEVVDNVQREQARDAIG